MAWQDIIITICIIFFSFALIPQIIQGFRKKQPLISKQTAIITSIGMYLLAITYITLRLFFSSIVSIITGGLWEILFLQSIIYKK